MTPTSATAETSRDGRERGMVLINVLLMVALASAVVLLMISAEDGALHRSARLTDAARARAIALGAETSAIVALRRDAEVAPVSDDSREPWAHLGAHAAPIRGGTFDFAITDAEDRLNINLLMRNDPTVLLLGRKLATGMGLPEDFVPTAAAYVQAVGPVADLSVLDAAKLPARQLSQLRGMMTALPYETTVNMNSVGEALLGALLGDPVAAHALVGLRDRQGYLRPEDFLLQHAGVPSIGGFTSTTFRVRAKVTIGETTQTLTSLLHRRGSGEAAKVVVIGRIWNAAPDSSAAGN